VRAASERLHLAQPTLSAQIRSLERWFGQRLFERVGRRLALTDFGRIVYRYADEIFSLGEQLVEEIEGGSPAARAELRVGVTDSVPKLVAYELLRPALELDETILVAEEGKAVELLARLSVHDLDVVISDSPIGPDVSIRAFNHRLGESTMTVCGSPELAGRYRSGFPVSLDGAPFLLPTENAVARRAIDRWVEAREMRLAVVAEFDDTALLKVFAQSGRGLFFAPTVTADEVCRQYRVEAVGTVGEVTEAFYAISVERRVTHPGVLAIADAARSDLFAESPSGERSGPIRERPKKRTEARSNAKSTANVKAKAKSKAKANVKAKKSEARSGPRKGRGPSTGRGTENARDPHRKRRSRG